MSKTFKKFIFVPMTALVLFAMLFSFVGCGEKKELPVKADVRITLVDKAWLPITDTEVWVSGISDMDMTYGYTTNSNGQFTIKNLGERDITVMIHTEEGSFSANYTVTRNDLELGEITIELSSLYLGFCPARNDNDEIFLSFCAITFCAAA